MLPTTRHVTQVLPLNRTSSGELKNSSFMNMNACESPECTPSRSGMF